MRQASGQCLECGELSWGCLGLPQEPRKRSEGTEFVARRVCFDSWHCHLGLRDSSLKLHFSVPQFPPWGMGIGSFALTASCISGEVQLFRSWKVVAIHHAIHLVENHSVRETPLGLVMV